MVTGFYQQPPSLSNTYVADRALREHLERLLPVEVLAEVEAELRAMGEAASGELRELAAQAEANPPRLMHYDPWGRRIDRIEVSPAWVVLHAHQARAGVAGLPYENRHGLYDRVVQHALLHLFGPSSAMYGCPISMTDGAARTLTDHAAPALRDRVVARLTSRDPDSAWTSGQWMTERTGGSDLGRSETIACCGEDDHWRLWGAKWFTSATTSQCALALARPEGAEPGSRGLALFLVELIDPDSGEAQVGDTILINRLKDKLGTRAVPTAELTFDGARATPVGDPEDGLRKMVGMLSVCRLHNSMGAAAALRRSTDLALAYARVREAFGQRLIDQPLHRETLAELQVEAEGAYVLTLRAIQLMGRVEHGLATAAEQRTLRALVPVVKLQTAKAAVAGVSEAVECFGGAGYIEDTGIPVLLRDSQILPIWEGTTNVLSLDLLRAATHDDALSALLGDLAERLAAAGPHGELDVVGALVNAERQRLEQRAHAWLDMDVAAVQIGMRSYAMRLGRCYTAALLAEHAAHRIHKHADQRATLVARRYAQRWLAAPPPEPPAEPNRLMESLQILPTDRDTQRAIDPLPA